MKKLLSALLILALALALLSATAFAAGNPELSKYSDAEIKQMYVFSREATPSSAPKPSATPTVICTPPSAGCSTTNSAGSWARWAA